MANHGWLPLGLKSEPLISRLPGRKIPTKFRCGQLLVRVTFHCYARREPGENCRFPLKFSDITPASVASPTDCPAAGYECPLYFPVSVTVSTVSVSPSTCGAFALMPRIADARDDKGLSRGQCSVCSARHTGRASNSAFIAISVCHTCP